MKRSRFFKGFVALVAPLMLAVVWGCDTVIPDEFPVPVPTPVPTPTPDKLPAPETPAPPPSTPPQLPGPTPTPAPTPPQTPQPAPPPSPAPTNPMPTPPPPPQPTVDAGRDLTAEDGAAITLMGATTNLTGMAATYRWTQLSGAAVTLTDADKLSASFTTPERSGDLDFRLSVEYPGGTTTDDVKVSVRCAPIMFVTCNDNNSIVSFRAPSSSSSPMTPRTVIAGQDTKLRGPMAVVLDRVGGVLVANGFSNRLAGYYDALTANGNVTPQRYVTEPEALLRNPQALAYDAAQDLLFAANFDDTPGAVNVYADASRLGLFALAAPVRQFRSYGLNNVRGMRLAATGELYVACAGFGMVSVYANASTLNGNVGTSREIRSMAFDGMVAGDVQLDAADHLFVVDANQPRLFVINKASEQNGEIVPDGIITIEGALSMRGISVDARGTAYVMDQTANAIHVVHNAATRNGMIKADVTIVDGALPLKGPWHAALVER